MNKYFKYSIAAFFGCHSFYRGLQLLLEQKSRKCMQKRIRFNRCVELPAYEDKGLHIHYGNGKTEFIAYGNNMKDQHMDDNKNLLITTLDKLNTEGYEVIFTSAGLGNKFGMIIKVFLRLKKK
ncbi:hypothetical protein [uncultured Cytophaga sp.]|uniref:hypothetical protein n=1 Tax=uncultured Cytophaga sp. TaxID=160238 RepID=UPI00261FBD02|nr:hypothetical protein [uncultured Cytophaga sp.]